MLKKIYNIPQVVSKNRGMVQVAFYPCYNQSHLIVHDNKYGITPNPFEPKIIDYLFFDEKRHIMSDYQRRKWQKLSGNKSKIYALIKNGVPIYIGSSKNASKRLLQHKRKYYPALKKDKNKVEYPEMIILCECPSEFQFDEEKRWITGASKIYKLTNIKSYKL